MRRSTDYTNYNAESFVQEHLEDENVKRSLDTAKQLATFTFPQQPGESALDAQRRIEQSFDKLKDQISADLKTSRQTDLQKEKEFFTEERAREITQKHFPGIDKARLLHLKEGGQAAYVAELTSMETGVANDPDLKENLQQVVNFYAALEETIPDKIDELRDECLKKHGLDGPMPDPEPSPNNDNAAIKHAPIGSNEFRAALQNERSAIEQARMNELLIPQDFKRSM